MRGQGNPAWVKGVSGNPKGRQKNAVTLAEAVRHVVDPMEWAREAWKQAKKGNGMVLGMLADRGWGKAPIEIMLATTTQKYDLEKLTNEELALFESLVEKMENARLLGTAVIDADSITSSEA